MKKLLSCIIMLFLSSNIIAQKTEAVSEDKERTTTLFDYGYPLTTADANFKNLFANFPLFISNSGHGLQLQSYKYVTSIKREEQIKLYLKKNIKVYLCGGGITSGFGRNDIENNLIRLGFPEPQPDKRVSKVLTKETNDNIEKIAKNIHLDDEVYVVKFIANGTRYDFYMFVNPKTKTVIKEGNFLGFDIPFYYADFHSKKH